MLGSERAAGGLQKSPTRDGDPVGPGRGESGGGLEGLADVIACCDVNRRQSPRIDRIDRGCVREQNVNR